MTTVSVDIDLSEFPDDAILREAALVLRGIKGATNETHPRLWPAFEELRKAVLAVGVREADDAPERSTAATLHDLASLRAYVEANPTIYRFAGH